MRREPESSSESLPPVRLFRGDLEHLVSLLSSDGRIELKHGDYVYDSVEELAKHVRQEPIRSLRMSRPIGSRGWSFSVDVSEGSVYVGAYDPADAERVAVVKEFLRKKRTRLGLPPSTRWNAFIGGALGLATVCLALVLRMSVYYGFGSKEAAGIVMAASFFPIGYLLLSNPFHFGHSSIFLHGEYERPSFWSRNKDTLIVGFITAILGLLAGRLL